MSDFKRNKPHVHVGSIGGGSLLLKSTVTAAVAKAATMMTSTNKRDRGEVARLFHEAYERMAPAFGYETRKETREFDPKSPNGRLMIAVCTEVMKRALAESREDAATEKGRREHTQQWYAERLAKIEEVAKREGLWPEIAAIIANGSGTRQLPNGSYVYDPPTYAQQLNSAKHKAERAEARAERLAELLRQCRDEMAGLPHSLGYDFTHLPKIDAALEQEPQE